MTRPARLDGRSTWRPAAPTRSVGDDAWGQLPCQVNDPELWFADKPAVLEHAKMLCVGCGARGRCLAGALARGERDGVWGGQIFCRGHMVSHKRGHGRPRRQDTGA